MILGFLLKKERMNEEPIRRSSVVNYFCLFFCWNDGRKRSICTRDVRRHRSAKKKEEEEEEKFDRKKENRRRTAYSKLDVCSRHSL